MKVSVVQENLAKAIQTVSRVVGTRTSLPILGNILIIANKSELTLCATNLELALSVTIGCKTETPGRVSVPARILSETIQGLMSEKLQLTSEGDALDISAAHSQVTIQGMSADEFPVIPEVGQKQVIHFPVEAIKGAFEKVMIAASLDESRPVLAGVYIKTTPEVLTVAATDSYRLAEEKLAMEGLDEGSVILPLRTAQELTRLLSQTDEETLEITLGENELRCTLNAVSLVSRLVEGNFPNYTQIIPTQTATTVLCAREELIAAVRLAGVFARESAHTIKLNFDKESIKIHAEAAQVGSNTSDVTAELKGNPMEISLNAKFLTDVLSVFSTPQVELRLNDRLDPFVIVPSEESPTSLHLIMPLRS